MYFEPHNKKALSSPIYFIVRKRRKGHGIYLKYPAGFTLKKAHWNPNKQKVREVSGIPFMEYNATLKKIKETVEDLFKKNDYYELTGDIIRNKLDIVLERASNNKIHSDTSFFFDAERLHKNEVLRVGEKGAKHLSNTIARLKEYDPKLDWHHVNYRLYVDFVSWMLKKTWTKNYMGKQVKNLRKIVEEGFRNGRIETPVHLTFKTMSEKVYNIYLNEEQLTILHEMKLPKAYERARDIFLVGCWTGQRVGTYMHIDQRDINLKDNTITLMTNKGGGKVVLPIHWQLREIIEKYDGKLPEPISEQRLNRYIKDICQAAKFTKTVVTEKTIKGKKQKIYKEQWEMVSSHTARRSCATNLHLRGVPVSTIMLVTNHDTEQQCRDYIKELMHDEVPAEVVGLDFWQKPDKLVSKK